MLNMTTLKEIAKNRLKKEVKTEEDLISFLEIWFSNKYNLPSNHPLFLEKTLEELVIDYFIDKLSNDPSEMKEQTVEEQVEYEDYLKEQMGDDYHEEYDFLLPENAPNKEKKEIQEEVLGEFEDDFEVK